MMSRRVLAWVVLSWAAITWGGRVSLLGDPGEAGLIVWLRIVASILVAVLATGAFLVGRWVRPTALAYAVVTGLVWSTSLVSVWLGDHSVGFRLVHTVLAGISLILVRLVGGEAIRQRSGPSKAPSSVRSAPWT